MHNVFRHLEMPSAQYIEFFTLASSLNVQYIVYFPSLRINTDLLNKT